MELKRNTRYKLIRLSEDINSLEDVKEKVLERTSKTLLPLIRIPDGMSDEEKYYYSCWENSASFKEGTITLHLGGSNEILESAKIKNFKYLKATAICEYASRRRMDESKQILPKIERLRTDEIECVFVLQNNQVFVIVFTSDEYSFQRLKKLISSDYLQSNESVNNLTSDLFHWLFYRHIEENRKIGDHITLNNIVGFKGIVLTDDHSFVGRSDQTAELIVTKAFICNGYPIKSINISLYSGNGNLTFFANEVDDLVVERSSAINIPIKKDEEDIAIPIFLYFVVIPELRKLYEAEEENFIGTEKLKFNAKIAIDVVLTISRKNKLDLQELFKLL